MESIVIMRAVCKCSVSSSFQTQGKIAFPYPFEVKLVMDLPWPMESEWKHVPSRQELQEPVCALPVLFPLPQ